MQLYHDQVMQVISACEPNRIGGPQKPIPLLT
jgi:hypothetical protein